MNSDGQQFHQYQQASPHPSSNDWAEKKTTKYDVENPCPGLIQAQKGVGVKPFNGIPTLILS
jgi:hypothetical protein